MLSAAVAAAILAAVPSASAATFDVNFSFIATDPPGSVAGTVNVTGTIVTTCVNCSVTGANVTFWSFNWSGASSGSASGTGADITGNGTSPLFAATGFIEFFTVSSSTMTFTNASDSTPHATFGPDNIFGCDFPGCVNFNNDAIHPGTLLPDVATGSTQFPLFADIAFVEVVVTPLPAALPLFATGLGALGVVGWRRKRKQAA